MVFASAVLRATAREAEHAAVKSGRLVRWYKANQQAVFNLLAGTGLFVVSVRGIMTRGELKDSKKEVEVLEQELSTLRDVLTGTDSEWRRQCASALGLSSDRVLRDELDRAVALSRARVSKDAVDIESHGGTVADESAPVPAAAGASTTRGLM
jgi:hypothetical protein